MMRQKELALLVDLAKLLKKYGQEPFKIIAKQLASPETPKQMVELLSEASKIAKVMKQTNKNIKPKKNKSFIQDSLAVLEKSDVPRYELFRQFYNDLQEKTILPTLREIKYFAVDRELPEIKSTSRDKAITQLIRILLPLPTETVADWIAVLRRHEETDGSLESWTNFILHKA